MTSDQRKKLSEIKQFKQLIAYLRDEMGWPINSESEFDELTYEYTTTELGIDDKSAAQIQEIKRLRPLSAKQPWGVFFVKFEPKKLPVVALRRILGQVALKKRASANPADRTMWAQEDLLFISNYGEGDDRQITLAHFSVPTGGHTLPSLKVLGWDSKDTVLHLDAVARELTEQLSWPDDESDVDAWRAQWRAAFTLGHQEVITTSKALSIRLAQLARDIRDRISTALTIETEDGPLTKLMKAFQESLIHDLTPNDFADMYAQTIAYGLLSSRIADPKKKSVDDLAAQMRLSPFLKELMEKFLQVGGRNSSAGLDFDELGVGDVVDLLDQANMEAVIADFGDRNPEEDPIIHFYELFLKEYDAQKRMSRGVFYTPRPIVSYIVRSVDELLRTEFGLLDGLADTTTWGEMSERHSKLQMPDGVSPHQAFVQILDPATGTGTFLVEAIDVIHTTLIRKWSAAGHPSKEIESLWNQYVSDHLLDKLHGYEILMAPYAIAHLKVSIKLLETGYKFRSDKRVRIYLTNSLEPASGYQLTLGMEPSLANEAQAVSDVKQNQHFTVVIGNPPYLADAGRGGDWISSLMRGKELLSGAETANYFAVDGVRLQEKNSKAINDYYVKFIRLAQFIVDRAGTGIVAYISNHGYLDNPTFRGVRWALMQSFAPIRVLDLHGNTKKKEVAPQGQKDENVFDIQQGVAISFFSKNPAHPNVVVLHADSWGDRSSKYEKLQNSSILSEHLEEVVAAPPLLLFTPINAGLAGAYLDWSPINEVMPVNSVGIVTSRDEFVVSMDNETLRDRIANLRSSKLTDESLREQYVRGSGAGKSIIGDSPTWHLADARQEIQADKHWNNRFTSIAYRPFDNRAIYYSPFLVDRPRTEVMQHFAQSQNIGLLFMRQVAMGGLYSHFGVSRHVVDARLFYSNKGLTSIAPLYLHSAPNKYIEDSQHSSLAAADVRSPNLSDAFVNDLSEALSAEFNAHHQDAAGTSFTPMDVLSYIYAIVSSPEYRTRYEAQLKVDFPRIPLPSNRKLFDALVKIGQVLVRLHLMEADVSLSSHAQRIGGDPVFVECVVRDRASVWLDKAQSNGFSGIPDEVWSYSFGGYQVCEKWLKDRKGRELSKSEITHYQTIVAILAETIRLGREIDEVIEQHGGWPDAFHRAGIQL